MARVENHCSIWEIQYLRNSIHWWLWVTYVSISESSFCLIYGLVGLTPRDPESVGLARYLGQGSASVVSTWFWCSGSKDHTFRDSTMEPLPLSSEGICVGFEQRDQVNGMGSVLQMKWNCFHPPAVKHRRVHFSGKWFQGAKFSPAWALLSSRPIWNAGWKQPLFLLRCHWSH